MSTQPVVVTFTAVMALTLIVVLWPRGRGVRLSIGALIVGATWGGYMATWPWNSTFCEYLRTRSCGYGTDVIVGLGWEVPVTGALIGAALANLLVWIGVTVANGLVDHRRSDTD